MTDREAPPEGDLSDWLIDQHGDTVVDDCAAWDEWGAWDEWRDQDEWAAGTEIRAPARSTRSVHRSTGARA